MKYYLWALKAKFVPDVIIVGYWDLLRWDRAEIQFYRVAFEDGAGWRYRIERNDLVRDLSYSRMLSPGTPHFNKLSRRLRLCALGLYVWNALVCSYLICSEHVCVSELLIILVVRNFHVQPDMRGFCIYFIIYIHTCYIHTHIIYICEIICTCLLQVLQVPYLV